MEIGESEISVNVVATILDCQLDTPVKRDAPMKMSLHQNGVWACYEALLDW